MGKPKKGKKDQDEDFGEDEVDLDPMANSQSEEMDAGLANKAAKKGKKGKKSRKDDDLDDVEREIAAMALEANGGEAETAESHPAAPKKEKKKKKKDADDDDGNESAEGKSALSRFQMLTVSDDDAGDKDSDEEEEKASNGAIVLGSVSNQDSQNKSKKDKKKAKKEKAKTAEEEDVDAILAALDEPKEKKKSKKKKKGGAEEETAEGEVKEEEPAPEVEKQAPKVVTIDDYESDEDTKKKKKKKNKKEKEEKEPEAEGEGEGEEKGEEGGEEEEEGGTVKTAAQKKKEKKERERQKKLQKQQQQQKKEEGGKEEGEHAEVSREATPAEAQEAAPAEAGEGGEAAGEGEGKKKKKKKGEKEEKEKKPKNAALLAKIKEQQAKLREEEEARKRAEEEAERQEEERIRKLEEQKRLEEERRLKKKMKKKEREERLKKEGKLLTDKQKQDRMRLNQMLDIIKEQGGNVPNKDEGRKKRPFYGKKKPKDQQKDETEKSPSPEEEQTPELPTEDATEQEEKTEEAVVEEEAESLKDDWAEDTASEDEESDKKVAEAKPSAKAPVKTQASTESKEESGGEEEESSEEESSEEESSESESEDDRTPAERGEEKVLKRRQEAEARRTTDELRAPVVCVLGHVDTGKTKILDKLRRTNVQDGEAGGITQQIGATNVPKDAVIEKTKMCKEFAKQPLKLPGLLIIDTPGHESFSNLRSRGSSLCDIAILVVDIMHGLEPQTIESINLLKSRKTPFIVALNKIDRLYGWKSFPQNDVVNTIKAQSAHTKSEFEERATKVMTQLAEEGLNAKLFYENPNPKEYVSLVPTSAHSGDGMGNLVTKICELTQTLLAKRIAYCDELQATVMEVKAIQGMGTTIDVILVNGSIREGQTVVLAGTEGPIITTIRGLLMPQPMKELRVKTNAYIHQKEVKAAQGVKIIAKDLERALAGLPLYVAHDKDEIEYFKKEAERGLEDALKSIKLSDRGVFVQASTLGSLEALLEYLRSTKVKYAGINIGPVHKKDIMKASIMLEHDPQYAVILAFDVEVKRDVQELADSVGVTIFTADIIYHLFDRFTEYRDNLLKKKQEEFKHVAVFPCKLKIMPQHVFNSRDPIVMGVEVVAGFLKEGTPLCVPTKGFVDIGRVASIEYNHKAVDVARHGQEVCIKILPIPGEAPKMFGRHFEADDLLVSKISRESIDAVKDYFRKEMSKSDWMLIMELKKMFEIL